MTNKNSEDTEVDFSIEFNPPTDPQALRESLEALKSEGHRQRATAQDFEEMLNETGFGKWSDGQISIEEVRETGSLDNSEIEKNQVLPSKLR